MDQFNIVDTPMYYMNAKGVCTMPDKIPDKVLDLEAEVHALLLLLNKLEDRVEKLEDGHTCPKHGSTLTCPVCDQEGGIYS